MQQRIKPSTWIVIKPLIALLSSRKFLVLLFPVLASFGLNLDGQTQALIIVVSAALFAGTTAWEDAAGKRAGQGWTRENLGD